MKVIKRSIVFMEVYFNQTLCLKGRRGSKGTDGPLGKNPGSAPGIENYTDSDTYL